ncbi:MAG: hypothetical protein M3Y48_07305 [Actinomycetota bacterium]|nr:hypothetical protein [Actinomycetota bacterium]MDQ2881049.1 hypothetical protein [Actinomycetota bacterium]
MQVLFNGGQAEPLFGASALLSVLTHADGYLVVLNRRPVSTPARRSGSRFTGSWTGHDHCVWPVVYGKLLLQSPHV